MGLQSHHERDVQEFLRFSRQRRNESLRSSESVFTSACESQLADETSMFTCEEVKEMVMGIWGAVQADIEADLISHSHMTALLLQQLLKEAEKYHIQLPMDVAQIENRCSM